MICIFPEEKQLKNAFKISQNQIYVRKCVFEVIWGLGASFECILRSYAVILSTSWKWTENFQERTTLIPPQPQACGGLGRKTQSCKHVISFRVTGWLPVLARVFFFNVRRFKGVYNEMRRNSATAVRYAYKCQCITEFILLCNFLSWHIKHKTNRHVISPPLQDRATSNYQVFIFCIKCV